MYKIETGVPIPEPPSRSKYPWAQMTAGDSLVFPDDASFHRARVAGASWLKRHADLGLQLTSRSNEKGGGRIWFEAVTCVH